MAVASSPTDRSWLQFERVGRPVREVARRLVSAARRRTPGAAQVAGVSAIAVGVFVLAGLGVGLIVAGVLAAGLGVLFEKDGG